MRTPCGTILAAGSLVLAASAMAADASAGDAALTERIRKDHPRMFFNADTWPRMKENAKGPARASLDALLKRVDSYPENPVCADFGPVQFHEVKTAGGTHKTTAASPIVNVKEWGSQAAECALAWRFTGERRHLEKARKMLETSVAAYHAAYRNRRAVNWYSTSRILALCAYDWIWEGLSEDERRAIIVPLVQHVEDVQPGKGKPNIVRSNCSGIETGFYGVSSLLWYSGLAAYGDGFCDALARKHLAQGRELCLRLVKQRSDGAGDDGALVSAVPIYSMGAYPWAHFNFFHTWLSATGENIAASYPKLALFPNWIYWTWIPNGSNPQQPLHSGFGDDLHTQNAIPMGRLYEHMTQYIHFFRDAAPAAARLAASLRDRAPCREFSADWPMYPFLFCGSDDGARPYPADELESIPLHARHFETLGQFVMRSGWRADSTYCTFTAGASIRQHKHHDENNFTIYKHDFLALDSGTRGAETDWNLRHYYAQTVAHNCVLVRRPGEPLPRYWGPSFNGPEGRTNDGGMYDAPAKVLAFETNGDYTYIASDATAAYGRKCSRVVRQFVHVLPDVFVVYDRVGAADPSNGKAWLLHTKNEPRVEGRLLTADSGRGRIFCETVLPDDAALTVVGGPGKEFWSNGKNWSVDEKFLASAEKEAGETGRGPYFGAWRLEVAPGAPRADDRFLHVLMAADTASRAPRTEKIEMDGMDGVKVMFPLASGGESEARVLFNRTGAVVGTIAVNGGAPHALATGVQRQSGLDPLR